MSSGYDTNFSLHTLHDEQKASTNSFYFLMTRVEKDDH
jgi:hypothetical protein